MPTHQADTLEGIASELTDGYRLYWLVAGITLIGLDTVTTAIAIKYGLGVEGNPLLAGIVARGHWMFLASLKANVMVAVYGVWKIAPQGSWHGRVPRASAIIGVGIVVFNTVMVGASAMIS